MFIHIHILWPLLQLLRSRVVVRKTSVFGTEFKGSPGVDWWEKREKYFLNLSFQSMNKVETGVAGVAPSHGWKVSMCYLSVNLFGGLWWGLEIWTLKTFLRFSYDSRIHYKNIYVCQYIDFSKEVIYNRHQFLRGGSYICRWLSFEHTYKLFTLILNSLHGWSPCFARLRPKTRSLTHKIEVLQCTSVTLALEGGVYEDLGSPCLENVVTQWEMLSQKNKERKKKRKMKVIVVEIEEDTHVDLVPQSDHI